LGVMIDTEQGKRPCPRRSEILRGRGRFEEQTPGPALPRGVLPICCARAQCPQGSAVAVFRSHLFKPVTAIAQEIAESPDFRVPGMLDERSEAPHEGRRDWLF